MSRRNNGPRARLSITALEDRSVPASLAAVPYAIGVPDGETGDIAVHAADGSTLYTIANPYGADFTGGVRVALADVTGDGTPDLVTAPGPGAVPTVHVIDGATQQEAAAFDAYESTFTGGVYLAAGDITGDGKAEIITGADQGGGPRVLALDGAAALAGGERALANFFAGPNSSRDGVQVGTVTDDSGGTSIVSTDLSSGSTGVFDSAGTSTGTLTGASGGPVCGAPSDDSGGGTGSSAAIAVTDDAATAVQGSYAGSGSGTLAVFAGRNSAPTVSTADATVTLDITSATLVTLSPRRGHPGVPPGADDSASTDDSTTANALDLTGTVTVSVDGGSLTVDRLVVIDAANAPAGSVLQSPTAADADKIVLARA